MNSVDVALEEEAFFEAFTVYDGAPVFTGEGGAVFVTAVIWEVFEDEL